MSELYPDDSTLLALTEDADTGVEYIPTGRSPYYLEFRKLIQRLLESTKRANDLRVYQDGPLTVGVRPGRFLMGSTPVEFLGATGILLANNTTTVLWIDATAVVQQGSDFPADRTSYIPLAEVAASGGLITSLMDRRGEALLSVPDLSFLNLTASAAELNQVAHGVAGSVTAGALITLTGGPTSNSDAYHTHAQVYTDSNSESEFRLTNANAGSSANIALKFDLSGRLPFVTRLYTDPSTGWLKQKYNTTTYALIGSTQVQYRNEGTLTATRTGKLMGIVPVDGVVSNVILSVGSNIVSTSSVDGVTATVKVNGTSVTGTDPKITSAAGSGFRSTSQGHGTAAIIKTDGTQNVTRGSVLTVDLTRSASGSVSVEATNVVVMITIRASQPE